MSLLLSWNKSQSIIKEKIGPHAYQTWINPLKIKEGHPLNVDQLAEDITQQGTKAQHISGVDRIIKFIIQNRKEPSVILIMSNGGFGQIHEKLLDHLEHGG